MPRNKYPEQTVERILKASYSLFIKKGYDNVSIQDIVNNLGDSSKDRKILPFSESGKPKRDNIREMFGLIEK